MTDEAVELTEEERALEAMRLETPIAIPENYTSLLSQLFPSAKPGQDYAVSDDGTQLIGWNLFGKPLSADDLESELSKAVLNGLRAKRVPLMSDSDLVATRFFKAGLPFPAEWKTYTQALRDITKAADPTTAKFPDRPAVPDDI